MSFVVHRYGPLEELVVIIGPRPKAARKISIPRERLFKYASRNHELRV